MGFLLGDFLYEETTHTKNVNIGKQSTCSCMYICTMFCLGAKYNGIV